MKILVIHTFGLGDMIMFSPALKSLICRYPKICIDFLILQKVSAESIQYCSNVNKIFFFEKTLRQNFLLLKKLRDNNYDYILHTSGTNILKISIMMLLLKGKQKIGEYTSIRIPWYKKQIQRFKNKHRVESNIEIIDLITHNNFSNAKPYFCLQEENYKFSNKYISKFKEKIYIGIHPGCNEKFTNKRWEIEKYMELINNLSDKYEDIKFFIFIGPDEKKIGKNLKKVIKNIELVENSLDNTAALISKMDLFITNDSGLGHIASCYDMDILTIFSKSTYANLNQIFPYSKNSYIIDFRTMKGCVNEVDIVYEKITNMLNTIKIKRGKSWL